MGDMRNNVLRFERAARLPGTELPPDFPKTLCRLAARVRRAGYTHEVIDLRIAAKVLYAVAKANDLGALAWHAQELHDLDLEQAESLPRLYELLEGMELALESALQRFRYH